MRPIKKILLFCAIVLSAYVPMADAADLIQVFQQALLSDPVYQQAISQRLSTREGVPINLAALLPSAVVTGNYPSFSRTLQSGSAVLRGTKASQTGYNYTLSLSQTVFNFGQFMGLASANALAKEADATLSAATQNLMITVATAYFNVLKDEDNLTYIKSTRTAYQKQLDQVTQQYKVGLKTITEVYTARASYETSVANYIAAQVTLATDKENLRAITGVFYPSLSKLRDDFPLLTPQPANINAWITTAGKQNWTVKSAQYAAESARKIITQQFSGHLPIINAIGSFSDNFSRTSGGTAGTATFLPRGTSHSHITAASLSIDIPLVEGGLVVAETRQAKYNYEVALQQLEFQLRSTLMQTRESYLNIVAGISKIQADRQSIKSNISSLEGMQAGYRVGTEILVNVLNQQQNVFQAQQQYATDRYAYVNNLLALKQAAGTLSVQDLQAINEWLVESRRTDSEGDLYQKIMAPR